LGGLLPSTHAGTLDVYVGYADGLRPSGFFPNPWRGEANVIFRGDNGPYDAGAIRLDNNSDFALTIQNLNFDLHGPNHPFHNINLWGTNIVVPAHYSLILTQTNGENFDTSDDPIAPNGQPLPKGAPPFPKIFVTYQDQTSEFDDTAHLLDTGGYDLAYNGANESLQWRPIGTSGIEDPGGLVPEPSSLLLAGASSLGTLAYGWRRRRVAARPSC
jgi:hypothetical protein